MASIFRVPKDDSGCSVRRAQGAAFIWTIHFSAEMVNCAELSFIGIGVQGTKDAYAGVPTRC